MHNQPHRKYFSECQPLHHRRNLQLLCDISLFYDSQLCCDSRTLYRQHARARSAVTRALQRISSRGDVPTLGTQGERDESITSSPIEPSNGLLTATPTRTSMQSPTRPHLSTTMSNAPAPSTNSSKSDPSTVTSASGNLQAPSIEQSVKLFKVFEALRHGDTETIAKEAKEDEEGKLKGTTMLHLAIQCADQSIVEFVLSQPGTDINVRDRDGNTPLHIASMLGRAPVVTLLVAQKALNDPIHNLQGKTALDLARNAEIFQQLQLARSIYIDSQVRKIHQLVDSGNYEALEQILGDSRVRSLLDVNGPELATESATTENGGTLLHEAARKKDLKLAQLLLLNGADPFRRDRKGKLPQDVTKDDRTRAILKKSPAAQAAQRSIQERDHPGR